MNLCHHLNCVLSCLVTFRNQGILGCSVDLLCKRDQFSACQHEHRDLFAEVLPVKKQLLEYLCPIFAVHRSMLHQLTVSADLEK